MTTHVVSRAWNAFCQQKQHLIVKAFRDVGVTLPIDGSHDDQLKIKGFAPADIDIGDWAQDLPIPQCNQPSQSHCSLLVETSEYDSLYYIWQCEGYHNTGSEQHTAGD
ncbi:unnamed protein product [Tuber aestivum]|uniref:Uncharacterized protein n=1 Tax=Tuber aestivum TaxID=59557 RepID=A0A292PJ58_9PEZI|nr:unnamed protein product [Tuber aestivum]